MDVQGLTRGGREMRVALAAAIWVFIAVPAWADYAVDFIRLTCVPETRYFELEYRALPGDAVFDSGTQTADPLGAWRRHGYVDPHQLREECRLPDSTFLVTAVQPEDSATGQCGAAPSIHLSLQRNGKPWLDEVTFGADCFGGPTITRIAVRDVAPGWGSLNADVCLAPHGEDTGPCEFLSETYGAIQQVMPITQTDLRGYIAARAAGPPPAAAGQPAGDWSLERYKRSRVPPCRLPGGALPADAVIYAAGVYGGRGLGYQIDQSGHAATRVDVTVHEPTRPVVLVVSAYEPTVWHIVRSRPTRLIAVLATGYHRQAVAGVPTDLPVLVSTHDNRGTCGYGLVEQGRTARVDAVAAKLLGRPIDQFFPVTQARVAVGPAVTPDTELVSSLDTPPDAFFDAAAPLAGPAGLEDAVRKGLLRLATAQDAAAWAAARRDPQQAGPLPAAPAGPPLFRTYVVLKPFVYPSGLFGGDSARFYVPPGVPLPTGERGHCTVYDFNTLECHGVSCK